MAHNLTPAVFQTALAALCGNYVVDVDATLRIMSLPLPGKAVCAILPPLGDGVTRVVCDLNKPYGHAHTRAMLQEWWESYREPVAFPDGTVELIHRQSPRQTDGPVELSLA